MLLNATDAMTSQTIEARKAYRAEDIVLVSDESDMLIRRRDDGKLVVDYSCFCSRAQGLPTVEHAVAQIAAPDLTPGGTPTTDRASTPHFGDHAGTAFAGDSAAAVAADVEANAQENEAQESAQDSREGAQHNGTAGRWSLEYVPERGRLSGPGSSEGIPRYQRQTTSGMQHGTHRLVCLSITCANSGGHIVR